MTHPGFFRITELENTEHEPREFVLECDYEVNLSECVISQPQKIFDKTRAFVYRKDIEKEVRSFQIDACAMTSKVEFTTKADPPKTANNESIFEF